MMDPTHEPIARRVAEQLLRVQAVRLRPDEPFTWASGWRSPIYCDNRLTLSFPAVRTYLKNALADRVRKEFADVQALAGVATAGIPQGALVADALNLPFLYVRPEPKKHGMGNQIEGRTEAGQRVVLIEDLISTGGSSLKAAEALRAAGVEVLGMVAIFTYGFPVSEDAFRAAGLSLHCLSDYAYLIEEAARMEYVSEHQLDALSAWRQDPAGWGR
jgi:orotate phosphoribosyltransferase